ncbi:helix-turn-helix domain-containing protein [Streptomyces sp. NPDC054933]
MYQAVRYQASRTGTWETASAFPHPRLRPGVIAYRGFRLELERPRRRWEAPVGVVTLVIGLGHRLRITGPTAPPAMFGACLSGLHTRASLGEHDGRLDGIEVLLAPWTAFTLFGVRMHELGDRTVDPGDLLGHRFALLTEALAATPSWRRRFALLDAVLVNWSSSGPTSSPRIVTAWAQLRRTEGATPVRQLAADVGWGVRQLENRFREQIGLGPKAAARVLRLQHALRLLAAGLPAARTAAACGFYDQAHFNGEFKTMTGRTPRTFIAERARLRTTAGPPTVDPLAGEVTSVVLAG